MEYNIMPDTSIEIENNDNECIICFEGPNNENILQTIDKFYIMPDCACSYNIHPKCIREWQRIKLQQQSSRLGIYHSRQLYCLKCNSKVVEKTIWRPLDDDNVRRNNFNVVCIIICSILGLITIMLITGLIIEMVRDK